MKHVTTHITRLLLLVAVVLLTTAMTTTAWGQVKFEENFSYTAGTLLTANGWSAHSGAGTNSHKVSIVGLTYSGYASSAIALADTFTTNGEDVNKTYASYPSGTTGAGTTIYYSFMVRIDSSAATGDYFVHLQKGATTFTARVFAKRNAGDGNVLFGIGKTSTIANINFSASSYAKSTTHLLVVKYSILSGATNDTLALWVNPTLGGSESTPTVLESTTDKAGTDVDTIYAVAIRQGTAANAPIGKVDGFRVGTRWEDVTGPLAVPTVTTGAATSITTTSATLNGSVNPNNASTTDTFDYGTTIGYGSSVTATQSPLAAGGTALTTSASISGLTQNQLYHFRDPATNSQGTTNGSDATFTTVPDAPVTTAATSVGETGFTATWTAGAGNAPATYTLDVATDAGFTSMVSGYPLAGIAATSSAVTGLSGGTTYYYRVRGVDAGGTSANSNTTSQLTLPGAPLASAGTGAGASSFTANWSAPSGTVTNYRLDVSSDISFGSFVSGYSDKTVASTSDLVTGLTNATKYYFRVRANNASGVGANSNIDSATTIAASVPSLSAPTATSIGTTTATLGATVDNDNNDPDTERGVVWSTSANPTTADTKIIEGSTGPGTYTVSATGLPNGTLVHYRGYAINGQGTGYTSDASFYTQKTEPSTHAGSFSASATSSSTIDLSWTVAAGADGYIILQRTGADPTGTPSDATGYSVSNTIGDGTVAAIVTSGATTSSTISGLSGGTEYHYSIMPFAWDGSNAGTYNYKTDPTVPTANAITLSAESDVIATGGFVYGSNIAYTLYTSVVNIDTSNSLPAFGVTVRDGGAGSDADAVATTLTGISFSVTNSTLLSRAALYDGPTELGEVAVSSSTVTFSGLSVVAADGGSKNLVLRVAYKTTVTDNTQNAYTVSAVSALSTGSTFAAANGGGATSSVAGDDNRVEVTATELHFVANVANTPVNTNFTASVKATDVNLNTDLDYGGTVTLAKASGPGTLSGSTTPVAASGVATTANLQFNAGGSYTLSATATGPSSTTSNTFIISSPAVFIVAGPANVPDGVLSTTTVDTLDWNSASTWTVVSGGSITGIPGSTDQVTLDNTSKAGSYVITVGKTVAASVKQVTIGYAGNTNEITLLIPRSSTVSNALTFGDNAPGNYDMIVDQGGVAYTQSGLTGSARSFNILGFAAAGDSVIVKPGGHYIHNTSSSISGIMIGLSKDINANAGNFEVRMPKTFTSAFHLTIAGFVCGTLTLSADSVANFDASTSQASAFGSCYIVNNLVVGPNTTFLAGTGGATYEGDWFVKGNVINNGSMTVGVNNTLAMIGTSAQTISGNSISLGKGIFIGNSAGVSLSTNLTVTGGSVLTNPASSLGGLKPEFPATIFTYPAVGVLTTGSSTIAINPAGVMDEGTNPVQGNVSATRTASQNVNQVFGNIGTEINAAGGAPGSTVVLRKTGVASTGNGHVSILRYFDITPTNNSALNATLKFSYILSELNGITETDLLLQKSTNSGTSWTGKSGTVSTGLHNITATGINGFSRWTAAAASSPLYITHTITMRKFADADGNPATTGDQTAKKWRMSLYQDSITAGTLINTGNPNSGVLATTSLEAGTYIATEEDSSGWLHLGRVHNGSLIVGAGKYDTLVVSGGNPGTVDFINQKVSSLTVLKFKDTDGNPGTIESAKKWHLAVYSGSVSGGNLVAEADTSLLYIAGLQAGLYIACESDSGASWVRLNGNQTRYDTVIITAGAAVADTFINFRPNSIVVRKFNDTDGQFATAGDRVAKVWYLAVRKNNSSGAVVASNSVAVLPANSLGDGTYYVSEADSAGWIHLGQVVNGSPIATTSNNATVVVANGQTATIDFVNAAPIYGASYRSFKEDSVALDKDNKGKVGKAVKRKADKVYFKFTLTAPANPTATLALTLKFSIATSGAVTRGLTKTDTILSWTNLKAVTTPTSIDTNGVIQVDGIGFKGTPVKTSYIWITTPKTTKGTVAAYLLNQPKLPMPNRVNALEETYAFGGFSSTTGLRVGLDKTVPDSTKFYGWLNTTKSGEVLKSLSDKTGLHTGGPRGFDVFTSSGKPLLKRQKTLPPAKHNNILLAHLIALKLNIAASALGKTPAGYGELAYNDPVSNPLNGKMIKEISAIGDELMMGSYSGPSHVFDTAAISNLNYVVGRLNSAFEGTLDTIHFADSLTFKGTRTLISVPYLMAIPGMEPSRIVPLAIPLAQMPVEYQLYQNYPNPFNPTTTIQFDLPEQAIVTLKIYNILGQEVATLIDHQLLDDGTQEAAFNANSLASGVYFYRILAQGVDEDGLNTQSFTTVKKMLLIK